MKPSMRERDESGQFKPNNSSAPIAHSPEGWVYFIQCAPPNGPVKIGWTKNIVQRLAQFRMCNPFPILLCLAQPGGRDREEALHGRFADQRLHGEWFAFGGPVEAYILEHARAPNTMVFRHDEHVNVLHDVRFS